MKFWFNKLVASFDNITENAFSARKLTAFWTVMLITASDIFYLMNGAFVGFNTYLIGHFLFVLILLGIITFEQIIKFTKANKGISENKTDKEQLNG